MYNFGIFLYKILLIFYLWNFNLYLIRRYTQKELVLGSKSLGTDLEKFKKSLLFQYKI
jgi:hypothetical protein